MTTATGAEEAKEAKARGNVFFKAKQYEEAIKEYTDAIELDATQHSFFSNRSACQAGLENWEEALKDAEECIKIKPDWPKGYSRKGLPLFKMKKFREAMEAYREGLTFDPENASLKAGLEECKNISSQGMNALFGGLKEKLKAIPQFAPWLLDPDFVGKLDLLAANPQMAMQMGVLQDPKVQQAMGAVLGISIQTPGGAGGQGDSPMKEPTPEPEISPEELAKSENLKEALDQKTEGNTLYKKRKWDEAFACYEKAAELDPEAPVYLLNQAAVRFMEKKFDECLVLCESAIKVQEKHYTDLKWKAKAYVRMGNVAKARGDLSLAIDYYRKAQLESKDPKVAKELKRSQEAKAKEVATNYLSDEEAEKAKERGNDCYKKGDWKNAITEYSDSLRRNPKQPKVYSNRATSYCKLMAWIPALEDCEKAIEMEPTFLKPYIRKGKIHFACKEYHKAMRSYRNVDKIAKQTGQSADVQSNIQEVLMKVHMENSEGVDEQRRARAEADPEVQAILRSPDISGLMAKAQADPSIIQRAMKDPDTAEKIEYLMLAGVIRTR